MKDSTALARGKQAKIRISANGVSLVFPRVVTSSGGNIGKRGKIKGFSRASARRLRNFLMGVDYSNAAAVTLTHPPVMTGMKGPEAAFVSLQWDKSNSRYCRSLIWRKEVTENGMPHFHCVLFPVEGVGVVEASEMLVSDWIRHCLMGWDISECFVQKVSADMNKAHHSKKRPSIQVLDGSRYLRYLLDHQSKHKRVQANTEGRAWGVWHRKLLPLVVPEEWNLEDDEKLLARRILRKVTRYARKSDCSFGWKHTKGRLAHAGVVAFFARSNDGKLGRRLVEYLKSRLWLKHDPLEEPLKPGRYFRSQFPGEDCAVEA